MAQAVVVVLDDEAGAAVRGLWGRIEGAGVQPADRFAPHVTLAMATEIPRRTREALRDDLRVLAVPDLWLSALSTFATSENVLVLAAVVDGELLAVHSAVHDVLAGKVRNPSAYYLPGSWMPHCTLAQGVDDAAMVTAFGAVFPAAPVRVRVRRIAVLDTATGDTELLT